MLRTRVGYCGGTTEAPTYRKIGDHAEAIQIDFDPQRVSYDQLLEIFWTAHNPCRRPWSRQYMSAVFYAGEAQREAIERTRKLYVGEDQTVHTEISKLDRFWVAEDYHQKYALRSDGELAAQVLGFFTSEAEFREAPVVTKLNAFCAGELSREDFDAELAKFGYHAIGDGVVEGIGQESADARSR